MSYNGEDMIGDDGFGTQEHYINSLRSQPAEREQELVVGNKLCANLTDKLRDIEAEAASLKSTLREAVVTLKQFEFSAGFMRSLCPSCGYSRLTVERVGHGSKCDYATLLAKIGKEVG